MGRHNGNAHAAAERARLKHQPVLARLEGEPIHRGDRVTHNVHGAGELLWSEWRGEAGEWIDPTGRPGRDRRRGAWHVLVRFDASGTSAMVKLEHVTRERIAR